MFITHHRCKLIIKIVIDKYIFTNNDYNSNIRGLELATLFYFSSILPTKLIKGNMSQS